MTNDHLLESGVITDRSFIWKTCPIIRCAVKTDLLHALRVQRQQQKEANTNANQTENDQ